METNLKLLKEILQITIHRGNSGSDVYDEEVEASYVEAISDAEEGYKTAHPTKSIERASLVEGVWENII